MNYPSIKAIESKLNINTDLAKKIRGVLDESFDYESLFDFSIYYNKPKKYYVKLSVINKLLEGHGVEYVSHIDDTYKEGFGLNYVNMGDTYTSTVIYNKETGRYIISDLGTMIEKSNKYL